MDPHETKLSHIHMLPFELVPKLFQYLCHFKFQHISTKSLQANVQAITRSTLQSRTLLGASIIIAKENRVHLGN